MLQQCKKNASHAKQMLIKTVTSLLDVLKNIYIMRRVGKTFWMFKMFEKKKTKIKLQKFLKFH